MAATDTYSNVLLYWSVFMANGKFLYVFAFRYTISKYSALLDHMLKLKINPKVLNFACSQRSKHCLTTYVMLNVHAVQPHKKKFDYINNF